MGHIYYGGIHTYMAWIIFLCRARIKQWIQVETFFFLAMKVFSGMNIELVSEVYTALT